MEVLKSRKPNRLKEYDYSLSGYYFVTICTHNHKELFGKIENNMMFLNDMGKMVDSVLNDLSQYYSGISIDTYVVMPNHIHAIIVIANSVGSGLCTGPLQINGLSLSDVIRRFKSFTTKQYTGAHLWQRSYYDYVIRKDESLDEIRKYISNNPIAWQDDEENIKSTQ